MLAVRLCTVRETGNVPVIERLRFKIVSETLERPFEAMDGREVHEVEMEMGVLLRRRSGE